jgi:hypothetical protein
MSATEPTQSQTANVFERIKNILLVPKEEWDRINLEPNALDKLYLGYVAPLAALAAVCAAIGFSVFGLGAFGFYVRTPFVSSLVGGLVQAALTVGSVFVLGVIANALAPTFASRQEPIQGHKLAAYASTAGILSGALMIFPPLGILTLLGLYSLVLLYLGLPRVMGTPDKSRVGYFVSLLILMIIASIVIGSITSEIRSRLSGFAAQHANVSDSGGDVSVTLPGGSTLDVSDLERATKQMEDAAAGISAGTTGGAGTSTATVDLAALEGLLPASLPGGFARTETASSGGEAMMGMATASATYANGDRRIELSVTHMGALGGLGGVAAAFGVQGNRQDANGYARVRTESGRTVSEEVDRAANTATLAILTQNGAAISADGSGGTTIEQLRAAIDAVGVARVEQLVTTP